MVLCGEGWWLSAQPYETIKLDQDQTKKLFQHMHDVDEIVLQEIFRSDHLVAGVTRRRCITSPPRRRVESYPVSRQLRMVPSSGAESYPTLASSVRESRNISHPSWLACWRSILRECGHLKSSLLKSQICCQRRKSTFTS